MKSQLPGPSWQGRQRIDWMAWGALTAAVLVVFWPVLHHAFTWDDDPILVSSPFLRVPLGWRNFLDAWRQPYAEMFIPVTWTFWLLAAGVSIWPTNTGIVQVSPIPFHAENLFFHLASSLLAYEILRQLVSRLCNVSGRRASTAALVGALLFALHPVQAESASWVCGFPCPLSGFFVELSLWSYLRFRAVRSHRWYWLAFGAFVTALLAKPQAVFLPLLLILLERILERTGWKTLRRRFALWGLAATVPVLLTRRLQPTEMFFSVTPWPARPLIALDALAFYFGKLVFPLRLAFDYGRTPEMVLGDPSRFWTWLIPAVALALLWRFRRSPVALTASALYGVALLPVLGLLPFHSQDISTVADRYLYFSLLGPGLATACWLATSRPSRATHFVCATVLLLAGAKSWSQTWVWRSKQTLFEHTFRVNPRSYVSSLSLGNLAGERGEYEKSVAYLREAIRLNPRYALAHNNLAVTLARRGEWKEAEEHLRQSLELSPVYSGAFDNLVDLLVRQQRFGELEELCHRIAKQGARNPVETHLKCGDTFAQAGRFALALAEYEATLALDPGVLAALNNAGNASFELGHRAEARRYFQQALQLAPGYAPAAQNLGRLLGREDSRVPGRAPAGGD